MGKEFTIDRNIDPVRVDIFLRKNLGGVSRSKIKRWIAEGEVRVDGRKIKKGHLLSGGERVFVSPGALEPFQLLPDDSICLRWIHEEDSFLIVDKPANIPTYPLKSREIGTLANALVARYPDLKNIGPDRREAGLVHRLDTPTSGLLVVARKEETYEMLRQQFRNHQVVKRYLAWVWGRIDQKGEIETSFESKGRRKVRVLPGNECKSLFVPVDHTADQTLLHITLTQGKRHQIRAHLSYLGHPVVGDRLYGKEDGATRLFLHATAIEFQHPKSKKRVIYKSPPREEEWRSLLNKMKTTEPIR